MSFCLLVAGCASLENYLSNNENTARALIKIGTAKYLVSNPSKGLKVSSLAERGIELTSGSGVISAETVAVLIKREVRFGSLDLAEQMLVEELINFIRVEFTDTQSIVDLSSLRKIFVWIKEVADEHNIHSPRLS